ncbi:MAG: hypothetical protein PHC70_00600 [Patescibacteria group bacterium]|nr:hypothetical protein [Patescibacteria group bacterium]
MKLEIIPAILAQSKKEFFKKLEAAAKLSKTVQIDVMDGLFVKNKTPRDLNNGRWFAEYLLNPPEDVPAIELHLMVEDPWSIIREWHEYLELKRAIWHIEAPIEHGELIEMTREFKIEPGLAISPGTSLEELRPFLKPGLIDEVLVMGVKPGRSGQKFMPEALKTLRTLRKRPKIRIGVDGGISLKNAKTIIKAGADRLNAAGAIFMAKDPSFAYKQLINN